MPGSLELLFLITTIGYVLTVPLFYTLILHFIVLRKEKQNLKFGKNFMVYVGIFILALFISSILMRLLISIESIRLEFFLHPYYISIIPSLLKTLIVGLLGAIWIKYTDKTKIGMKASFKVAGIVFLISIVFTFILEILQQNFQY